MNEYNNELVENDFGGEERQDKQSLFGWGKFILFFVTYLGVQIVITAVPMIFAVVSAVVNNGDIEEAIDVVATNPWMLYLDFIAFLIAILIFKSTRQFLKGSFSFEPMKKVSSYLYIIGAIAFMMLTQYVILDVLGWEDSTGQVETFGLDRLSLDWITITILMIGMAIITPIKEEILFRGVLHGFLSERWNFWWGLIISSAIFGVLHLGYPLSATLMGISFVVLYKLTRSLIVPITLHIVWNAYAVLSLITYVNSL